MKGRATGFDAAVRALEQGQPVVFPTDTVAGLGVAVSWCQSPDILFHLKGRPAGKPVSWLVADAADLDRYGADVPEEARAAIAERWPGGFTAIVKAGANVPMPYRSAAGTIGLRMPASERARELVRAVGCPIATTSANLSGAEAPRRVRDVAPELANAVVVLDWGEEGSGSASEVVDFTQSPPAVLRAR